MVGLRWTSKGTAVMLLFSIIILVLVDQSRPYSVGAPDAACGDMTPGHGNTIQSSEPPYTITPNDTRFSGGDRIQVKLEGKDAKIKGFFIQARQTEDGTPIGTFFTAVHKISTCNSGLNNAVTHANPNEKDVVTLEWEAPSDYEGDVTFRATVVQSYVTFWTSVRSDKLEVVKRSAPVEPKVAEGGTEVSDTDAASTKAATTTEQAKPVGIAAALADLYEGCGVTKTCSGYPNKCLDKKNCRFLATYTYVGDEEYEFEVKGPGGGDRYVAVGLSADMAMGDDSVVVCGSKDGNVDVYMTWNEGKSNTNIRDNKVGLSIKDAGEMDGSLYCRFHRARVTKPMKVEFDLEKERFHIMVSAGTISNDNRLQYHGENRIVSARLVSLGETTKVTFVDTRMLKAIHGSLMIGAWVMFASCGIIFARYFKQTWLAARCCSVDQWFHLHRFCMISTWSLTMGALGLIIYTLQSFEVSYHSIVGIVSCGLCFIQPLMAACRPHPQAKNRSVFNWLHWFVGNTAHILGIAAIFLGYRQFLGGDRNWVKEVAWYTLIAFIALNCIVHIVLSIAQCISDRRPKNSEVFPLKDMSSSRTLLQSEDVRMDAPHGCFRKFVLAMYLPLNWIATALLIIFVVVSREDIENQLTEWGVPEIWKEV